MRAALTNPSAFEAALEAAFNARSKTSEAQAAAFDRFARLGLPNRRAEGWKWTDFNNALRGFQPANGACEALEIAPSPFAALNPIELCIVDGRIAVPDEKIEGLRFGVMDPQAADPGFDNHAMLALNVAMTRKALGFRVLEGVDLERPILIRHINRSGAPQFSQALLRVHDNAKVRVIESFEGEGAFYSTLFHASLGEGARLDRAVLQESGADAVIHAFFGVLVARGAHLKQTALSTGGRLSRHETFALCPDEGASVELSSAALLSGERHADFTSLVRFQGESGKARQLHKGVARDRARNVFQGKFHVMRGAQKTDAKMTANALLLSEGAEANHKPELEIYADNVECAHGSTVGALDDDALFYLRQRGLSEHEARALLVEAFAGEVVETIDNGALRDVFVARVRDWMDKE